MENEPHRNVMHKNSKNRSIPIDRLSKKEREVLEGLRDEKDFVQSIPGGWYQAEQKISGKIGYSLLRKCYIKAEDFCHDNFYYYMITSDGLEALKHKIYTPLIYRILKEKEDNVKQSI